MGFQAGRGDAETILRSLTISENYPIFGFSSHFFPLANFDSCRREEERQEKGAEDSVTLKAGHPHQAGHNKSGGTAFPYAPIKKKLARRIARVYGSRAMRWALRVRQHEPIECLTRPHSRFYISMIATATAPTGMKFLCAHRGK